MVTADEEHEDGTLSYRAVPVRAGRDLARLSMASVTARATWSAWRASYAGHVSRIMSRYDSDLARYRQLLQRHVRDGDRVLHLGCGWDRSQVVSAYIDRCEIVGVDLARDVAERYPGQFWRGDAAHLPFGGSAFDIVCCEYVIEHLIEPDACFAEVSRVLRPGGLFVFLTPNRWSYKAVAAALTPQWVHQLAAQHLRPDSRAPGDVFPTHYRANTSGAIRRLAQRHGLVMESVELLNNGPTWFRRLPGLFELGHAYHQMIGRIGWLHGLRCAVLASVRRQGIGHGRAALLIRCTACGADGMRRLDQGYRCESCGRVYGALGGGCETLE